MQHFQLPFPHSPLFWNIFPFPKHIFLNSTYFLFSTTCPMFLRHIQTLTTPKQKESNRPKCWDIGISFFWDCTRIWQKQTGSFYPFYNKYHWGTATSSPCPQATPFFKENYHTMQIIANHNNPNDTLYIHPFPTSTLTAYFLIKDALLCFLTRTPLLNPQRQNVTLITFQGWDTRVWHENLKRTRIRKMRVQWTTSDFIWLNLTALVFKWPTKCLIRWCTKRLSLQLRKPRLTTGSGTVVLVEVERSRHARKCEADWFSLFPFCLMCKGWFNTDCFCQ